MSERKELERQYAALVELERRRREAPLLFYHRLLVGHPKQRAFHEAGKKPGIRKRLFLGGNRSGKTTAGSREALAHAYGYRFWELPDLKLTASGDLPHRDTVPTVHWTRRADGLPTRLPSVGMVCTGQQRLRGVGETLYPALHDALPHGVRESKRFRVLRGAQAVPDWMELPNGSRILFASGEQDDLAFEGYTVDWIWLDEPVRQSIFNALLMRGFDYCAPVWLTLTPLTAVSAWMLPLKEDPPKDTAVVEVAMADNPANTAEKIRELVDNGEMDDREKDARLYGRFECLGDRVFTRFDPSVHVRPSFMPPASWVHGLTVDPHHRRPPYMAWWALDPATGAYHFYKEYPPGGEFHKLRGGGITPAETATVIRNAEGRVPARHRLVDPKFGKAEHLRHGYREPPWVELMAEFGLRFEAQIAGAADLDRGFVKVNDLLGYDKNCAVGPSNQPHLYVHDCCTSLIQSFMRFAYVDVKDPVKGLHRKVSEEFKDPIDCVRYTVLFDVPVTDEEFEEMQPFTAKELEDANAYG